MTVVMVLEVPGGTREQYEVATKAVFGGTLHPHSEDIPDGMISHVSYERDGGLTVVDVWSSKEEFESFRDDRLMRAIQTSGMKDTAPQFYEAINVITSRQLTSA